MRFRFVLSKKIGNDRPLKMCAIGSLADRPLSFMFSISRWLLRQFTGCIERPLDGVSTQPAELCAGDLRLADLPYIYF